MATESVSFTLRLPKGLHDRLISVVAATGNEVTRSGLCVQFIEQALAQLAVCPTMVQGYNPELDKAARQMAERERKKTPRKTERQGE